MTRDGFRDSAERLVVLAALVLLCAAAAAQLSFAPSAQTRHDGPRSAGPADAGVLLDGPFCYHAAVRADERSESPASSVVPRSFKRGRPANSRSFQSSAGQIPFERAFFSQRVRRQFLTSQTSVCSLYLILLKLRN